MKKLDVAVKYSFVCDHCGERSWFHEVKLPYENKANVDDNTFVRNSVVAVDNKLKNVRKQLRQNNFAFFFSTTPCEKCGQTQVWQQYIASRGWVDVLFGLLLVLLTAACVISVLMIVVVGIIILADEALRNDPAMWGKLLWLATPFPLMGLYIFMAEIYSRRLKARLGPVKNKPEISVCANLRGDRCVVDGTDTGPCSWVAPHLFAHCNVRLMRIGYKAPMSALELSGRPENAPSAPATASSCGAASTKEHKHSFQLVPGKCVKVCSVCGQEDAPRNAQHHFQPVPGKCVQVCSVCGHEADSYTAQHSYQLLDGKCEEKCMICGNTRPADHQYADGKCRQCGADIDSDGVNGIPPLIWAALEGDVKEVKFLLAAGANTNVKVSDGETALMAAAKKGYDQAHMEIVELLIAHGADVNATDVYGSSAVRLAQRKGLTKVVEFLTVHGGKYLGA